jgi:hypothetical protein
MLPMPCSIALVTGSSTEFDDGVIMPRRLFMMVTSCRHGSPFCVLFNHLAMIAPIAPRNDLRRTIQNETAR